MDDSYKHFVRPMGSVSSKGEQKVYVRYTHDLNLFELSDRIVKYLEGEKSTKVPYIDVKIKELESRIKTPQFTISRNSDLKAIGKLKKKKEEILSGKYKTEFLQETQGLLNRYKKLGTTSTKNIFGIDEQPIDEDEDSKYNRNLTISQYLEICKDYVPIEIDRRYVPKYACAECGCDLDENTGPSETSEITCPDCGLTTQMFKQYTGNDNESSDYEDRENYLKAIHRFQGRQKVNLPENLFKDLDDYFISRGLPIGEQVRKTDKIDGRRGQEGLIGKKILRKALANKGYNSHYDDINLICHEYWDWDLPDISHLEEDLLNDYDRTEKVLKRIKGSRRKATINTNYRLRRHLEALNFQIKPDDFKSIDTKDISEMYDLWWKQMCDETGIKYK